MLFKTLVLVGELGKNLTPSKLGSAEFVDKFISYLQRRMLCFARRQHSEEILMKLIHHANLPIIRESNSRLRLLFANLLTIS
jgi:hypothetical protein